MVRAFRNKAVMYFVIINVIYGLSSLFVYVLWKHVIPFVSLVLCASAIIISLCYGLLVDTGQERENREHE